MTDFKSLFLLDPDVVFLNHGSFGATPRPVFDTYQQWQHQLELQPVHFITKQLSGHLATARQAMGDYINSHPDNLVLVPNATYAANIVANSLQLGAGDEVITTDHAYGACDNAWQFHSQKKGFTLIRQPISFPITSDEQIIEELWQAVTPRTKVLFLSHITSSTAQRFPIKAICQRAKEAGILTVIDGAHAPGQIPLDMDDLQADFYLGNVHKWLCGPKGVAFLYTRPGIQHLIQPLVIGWGWGENRTLTFGSDYLDYLQFLGTDDLAGYLSVPSAIEFQAQNDWPTVQKSCHKLLTEGVERVVNLTGIPSCYIDDSYYHQMAIIPLPPIADLPAFKDQLYDQYRIEIPCIQWQDHQFIRISIQAYNTPRDIDILLQALENLLPS